MLLNTLQCPGQPHSNAFSSPTCPSATFEKSCETWTGSLIPKTFQTDICVLYFSGIHRFKENTVGLTLWKSESQAWIGIKNV